MIKQNIFLAFAALLLSFTSCEEETFDPVLSLGDAPTLSAPAAGTSFVIEEGTEDDEFATFNWSAGDFGFDAGPTYTVQADLAGNNFADPIDLIAGSNATSGSVKNSTVNNFLISRDVAGGAATDIEVRVRAAVGISADNNVLVSAPITLNVTPFEAERVYPSLFVPGAHQGWDPPSAPLIFDVQENGNFDGYVYFAEDNNNFKFTDSPNWDNGNFGDDDGDGVFEDGGGDIAAGAAGLYRLNVNLNERSYTVARTDWGLIGSATPDAWDADQDMTLDVASETYSITLDLVEGEIKFRANDEWVIDFGDTGADGIADYGGDNIAIAEAGNYTITLNLSGPIYTYTVTKN